MFKVKDVIYNRALLQYMPHGINPKVFYPIEDKQFISNKRKEFLNNKNYEFVIFHNSRNIQRKRTSNILLAFRAFVDNLPVEKRSSVCLILHTDVKADAGTDLLAVKEAFCPSYDVYFSHNRLSPEEMNLLYNISDVTISISSSEGFGLSTAESIMAGTPIIINMTGGLQDQAGQKDDAGNSVVFDMNFGSNNEKRFSNIGEWVYATWPSCRTVQGSIPTPYIFDDNSRWEDAAEGMLYWYLMPLEKRKLCGKKGRDWALTSGGLNAKNMCETFIEGMEFVFNNWIPKKPFDVYTLANYVGHTMPNNSMGFELPVFDHDKLKQQASNVVDKI